MKSVLISIRPEWCEKIASGEKSIEVRKTRPKIDPPFKCYIYMTEGYASYPVSNNMICHNAGGRCVIGEFVCKKIQRFDCGYDSRYNVTGAEIGDMCLTYDQFYRYGKNRPIFGFGIYDLKIYDTPKSLHDLYAPCTPACNFSEECGGSNAESCLFPVERAPQSWMYVEELI